MITEIKKGEKLIALLVDNADIEEGTHPITNSAWPLQTLMMRRGPGHIFAKHTHTVMDRTIATLQERARRSAIAKSQRMGGGRRRKVGSELTRRV